MDEQSRGHPGSHTMQASKQKKSSRPSQPGRPSKKKGPSSKSSRQTQTGAAMFRDNAWRVGMKDLVAHRIAWVCGSIYVGNGTNGATDSVYFQSNTSGLVPGNSGGGQVPVLGSDGGVGISYVNDIEKHYSRKIIRSCRLRLFSAQPSTTNSMVCLIAPIRGCGASGDTVTFTAATTAAPSYSNVIGMSGCINTPSYKDNSLDLTPYIAGGSGARQNEFTINRDGDTAGTAWGAGTIDLVGLAPCAFVVSGTNGTTGLRGAVTHYVCIETVVDLLDFIGGMSNPNPISFTATPEEAMCYLKTLMSLPQKEVRDSHLVKALVRFIGQQQNQAAVERSKFC